MKYSKALTRVLAINKANPTTIKQWLKYRTEYDSLINQVPREEHKFLEEFRLGVLMPVMGSIDNVIPKHITTTRHLFTAVRSRYYLVKNQKHVSEWKRGKWVTHTHCNHTVYVVSVAVFKGRTLEWLRGPSDVVKKYTLPEGYSWDSDIFGLKIVDSDGIDLHVEDVYLKCYLDSEYGIVNLIQFFLKEKQHKLNIAAQHLRQEEYIEYYKNTIQLLTEQLSTTRVTFQDSRNAGNCIEGTLAYAERVLKIPREDVINGSYLFSVPASRLFNKGDERATKACVAAFRRETLVSI